MEYIYGAYCFTKKTVQLPLQLTNEYYQDLDNVELEDKDGRVVNLTLGDNVLVGISPEHEIIKGTIDEIKIASGQEHPFTKLFIGGKEVSVNFIEFVVKF